MTYYNETSFRRKIIIRLTQVSAILIGAILYGTLGFWLLENTTLFDAFYMAVITMTTVGYDEVIALDDKGRLFAVTSIFVGLTCSGISLAMITNLIFEEALLDVFKGRKMTKKLEQVRDHYIVCGCGTTGTSILEELLERGHQVVVVDNKPLNDELPASCLYVQGDARQDDVLEQAGIQRAKGLATTLTGDADNVFVTLTARALNPDLRIVSRYKDPDSGKKLSTAGADEAVSPYRMGGQRLAVALSDPAFHKILNASFKKTSLSVRFQHLHLPENSVLRNKSLEESDFRTNAMGALVVGVVDKKGQTIFNPDPEYSLKSTDEILVLGDEDQLQALENYLADTRSI
jgi:voltage-gated potassium channel